MTDLQEQFLLQYLLRITGELETQEVCARQKLSRYDADPVDVIEFIESRVASATAYRIAEDIGKILSMKI